MIKNSIKVNLILFVIGFFVGLVLSKPSFFEIISLFLGVLNTTLIFAVFVYLKKENFLLL